MKYITPLHRPIILMNGLIFHEFHGVHDFEAQQGNTFVLDVELRVNVRQAGSTDSLEDTLDYERIYATISREFKQRSKLLENICQRITDALYKEFTKIESIRLKLCKKNPPIKGLCEEVCLVWDTPINIWAGPNVHSIDEPPSAAGASTVDPL